MITEQYMKEELRYHQRLSLNKILSEVTEDSPQLLIAKQLYSVFYDDEPDIITLYFFIQNEVPVIIEGANYWSTLEAENLNYTPSEEEIAAGADRIKTRELSTIYKLARDYGQDPDTIENWKYQKVFLILWDNCEQAKYEKRLNDIYTRKNRK